MARAAALRRVTRNVEEFAFLFTFWAFLRQHSSAEYKSALPTFPVCLITLGTDISGEPALCGVSTVSTFITFFFILHELHLQVYIRYSRITSVKNLDKSTLFSDFLTFCDYDKPIRISIIPSILFMGI
jgi:hypothetical protein